MNISVLLDLRVMSDKKGLGFLGVVSSSDNYSEFSKISLIGQMFRLFLHQAFPSSTSLFVNAGASANGGIPKLGHDTSGLSAPLTSFLGTAAILNRPFFLLWRAVVSCLRDARARAKLLCAGDLELNLFGY